MNLFQRFIKSITDFKSYKIFKEESMKKSIIYGLVIAIVFGIVANVYPAIVSLNYSEKIEPIIENKVPDFKIKDGKLIIEGDKQEEFEANGITVKFDPKDQWKNNFNNIENGILLYSDGITVRKDNNEVLNKKYSEVYTSEIDSSIIKEVIKYRKPIIIIGYVMMAIGFSIGFFILALIVSLIGILIKNSIGYKCDFKTLYKLSLYCLTLAVVINALGSIMMVKIPYILFVGVGCFYLYKALISIKAQEQKRL